MRSIIKKTKVKVKDRKRTVMFHELAIGQIFVSKTCTFIKCEDSRAVVIYNPSMNTAGEYVTPPLGEPCQPVKKATFKLA